MRFLAPKLELVGKCDVKAAGRLLTYFGGCDYLRMASHPQVLRGVREGLRELGLNVSASRMTTGNHPIYDELEQALRKFFAVPAALLVATGYATNLVVAQGLAGQFSHALVDERAHASLQDAAAMLRCPVRSFVHRDVESLRSTLKRAGRGAQIIVLTDGMFSHDGSVAPLHDYQRVMPSTSWLLVDDAHGAGILGRMGRGSLECEGVSGPRIIQTITLSKAFGVFGGAILCSEAARGEIIGRSSMFAGNTPLPLPLAKAAMEAIRWMRKNPQARQRLRANADFVKSALREAGWALPNFPGPIISVVPKSTRQRTILERKLLAVQIYPSFIRYPGGPPRGYFRFAVSSEHTLEQLRRLVGVISNQ